MVKMDSVRKQRDTNSLRVAGVKAAGQTPISIILNIGSISCSPESTEDECNGIVQGDCLETGQGDVGLKMRGNCSISNDQEMLKGKDQIEGKVWEGYSVHGNENVLTVDQKVVKLHVGSPTTDQTPSHDKRPATCMIQSPEEHDERPTTDVAHSLDERPTANVAQSEERPTANVTQSEERPTANVTQSEERPTANVTQSEERATANVTQSEERPTANVTQSEERPTANVTQSEERPTANVTQSEERPTANVAQSDERQATDLALSLDEEVKIDVRNKFQLTMKENVTILPDPMTSPERILDVALGRKSSSRFSPKSNRLAELLLAFSLVISVSSSVSATHLIPPGQELPRKCFDLLETDGNDCPQYDDPFFESRYTSLNETCCAGYPYLDFHCQMDYQKSGEQFSMIACLRTVEVPKNHSGRMMGYDTSDPYFKVEKLDDAQAKEPARESWQVTNSYHPHAKIRCEGLGQQLLCLGVEDNLCTCQVRFYPNGKGCKSGFGAEDACVCQHLDCPVGYHAARNFSKQIGGSCSDLFPDFLAEFFCKENPTPASSISSTTQSTFAGSSTTSHPPNTTRAGGDDDEKKDSKTTMIALVVVFLLIVLIFLVVLVIKYWAKPKAKLSSLCSCGNVIVNCLKSYGQCSDGSSEPVDGSPGSVFLASASSESVV